MPGTVPHWIDGKPDHATPARSGAVHNPATGAVVAHVAFAESADVDRAVAAAKAAFATWRHSSLAQRTRILFAFRELLDRHTDELAELICTEHGKTVPDACGEVTRGLEIVEFACGISQHLKGDMSENVSTEVDSYSLRQPLGVVAGITPFNFPAMVPLWMFPIAIAAGNTFVLKPSEKDPSASVRIAELLAEAGLPDGVFNVVHGDKAAVDALLRHRDVAAVSFVGSTPIARYVYEAGTQAGKRVQALGGAKNHMVVLPDADLDLAADAAVNAGSGAAGERCMAISVVVAVGSAGDALTARIADRLPALKVGPGNQAGNGMGPLITAEHRDRVKAYIDAGVEQGAMLVADGRSLVVDVELVNSNPYANGAALFTCDGGVARKFQHEVEVGMVGINVPIPVPASSYSFGGWRNSLFGDTHMYGAEGVRFWTRGKVVTSRWPSPDHRGINLGFPQN